MAVLAERIRKAVDSAARLTASERREAEAERELREAHEAYGQLLGTGRGDTPKPYPEKLAQAKARVLAAEEKLDELRANPDVHG
jgi:hypothetical protein